MRFYIIGFKNSGKTTFGRELARRLGIEFIDLDEYIERKFGRSIPDIYLELGEAEFRRIESEALREVSKGEYVVISTGGGVPCGKDNMKIILESGISVYLKVDDETIVQRLKQASLTRPLVMGKTEDEIRDYLKDLKQKCEHLYLLADYIIEENTPSVETLEMLMKNEGKTRE